MNYLSIGGAIPRFIDFHMDDSSLTMKKKIYWHIKRIFKSNKAPKETDEE